MRHGQITLFFCAADLLPVTGAAARPQRNQDTFGSRWEASFSRLLTKLHCPMGELGAPLRGVGGVNSLLPVESRRNEGVSRGGRHRNRLNYDAPLGAFGSFTA